MSEQNPSSKPTILLSAGGTGGHVFPAVSLAEALYKRGYQPILATDERAAHFDYPAWLEVKVLSARSPAGGLSQKLRGGFSLIKSIGEAIALQRQYRPQAIVGFGGYPSFPGIAAAMLCKVPLILHEQNRYLGKANRMAAKMAKKIALSFPNTRGIPTAAADKITLVGNPARPEIMALREAGYHLPKAGQKFELLVFAGSQGATQFSEVVPDALRRLPLALRQRLKVTQQCRQEDIARVEAFYQDEAIEAEIKPFFDDMPERLKQAHLVICRSGASTVTEMMAAGRPAIYVPLAIATDDHQTLNAQYLESHNAGWLLPSSQFEPEALHARVEFAMQNLPVLQQTAKATHQLATPNAAERLADVVVAA